ncbi:PDR/VanB family oxidoreductase [Alkalihalobacillus sp. TS-13]|uniref:PDR/VanB family oxidoreductase n=1 Tax=Alkalihalobacillus sp. TS-13 TaxID=2842455 RepID=UPI001C87D197|nr:PDR/VanB family oxidoreductase [Alkalihalobacillus sp. TS-13]
MKQTMPLTVEKIEKETDTITTFTLTSEDFVLPQFGAGSHITVHLPMGRRQYSLVNNPLEMNNEYRIAVKKISAQHGGSGFMHECVREGDTLTISTPDNFLPLKTEAKHHVFFAGGIGITPFMSMMAYLKEIGHSFELHYAARSEKECAFYHHIQHHYQDAVSCFFMDREEKTKRLQQAMQNRTMGTHMYICGPQPFMNMLVDYAHELGYPNKVIHEERFQPASVIENPQPFSVTVTKSEKTFQVKSDQTLLDALNEQRIDVPFNCRMGVCGTCEVGVEAGEILHCESFLTEEEKEDKMLTCVSRGVDHIKLDL